MEFFRFQLFQWDILVVEGNFDLGYFLYTKVNNEKDLDRQPAENAIILGRCWSGKKLITSDNKAFELEIQKVICQSWTLLQLVDLKEVGNNSLIAGFCKEKCILINTPLCLCFLWVFLILLLRVDVMSHSWL